MAATGDLTIGAGGSVTGGSATLATLGDFTNNGGAAAVTVGSGGRWLIYSTDPTLDNDGGLTPAFFQYNAPYNIATLTGATPAASGNGRLYSLAPTLTVTGVTKVYDATTNLPTTAAAYSVTGAINNDVVTLNASGVSGSYADKNVATGIGVTLSGLAASATNNGIPVFGYRIGAGRKARRSARSRRRR